MQQYSVYPRQISDITEEQSTNTGSDTDAHDRKLSIRVLEHHLHEFPYVNIRDEISETDIPIDLRIHASTRCLTHFCRDYSCDLELQVRVT